MPANVGTLIRKFDSSCYQTKYCLLAILSDYDSKAGQHYKLFGEVLRAYRLEKRLTQEQLSERVDVIRPFISSLENGTRQPSLDMVLRLAKALGITPGKLIDPIAEKMEQK